jgi:hypothetical protein
MPLTEPPKPCEKFSDGRLSGFTEHIAATGCKKCAAVLFRMRLDLMTSQKYWLYSRTFLSYS